MRARGPRGEPWGPQGALGTSSLALPWAPWPSWVALFFRKTQLELQGMSGKWPESHAITMCGRSLKLIERERERRESQKEQGKVKVLEQACFKGKRGAPMGYIMIYPMGYIMIFP